MTRNGIKAIAVIAVATLISIQGAVEAPIGQVASDALSSLSSLWSGSAPDPWIGRVKTVHGTASIIRGAEHRPATLGAPLYREDVIETGADGSIGITFVDDSVFSTGPDSQVALTEFHFDVSTAKGDMLAELKKGTLAVVSGQITHTTPGAMSIKTPTSILGVRGTTFAVELATPGTADHDAAASHCRPDGDGGSASAGVPAAPDTVGAAASAGPAPANSAATGNTAAPASPAAADTAAPPPPAVAADAGGAAPSAATAGAAAQAPCDATMPRPEERYVVLPNADGRPGSGAITVKLGDTATTLDQPYAAAELRDGADKPITMDAAEAQAIFKQALAARPMLPAHFRVFFLLDSDQMTAESAPAFDAVVAEVKQRQTYDVGLVGYTDTLADEAHNQRLSVRRAEAVSRALVKGGVEPKAITVEGHGESEQLVPTAAGVAEPRNRRVEIIIR